MTQVHPSECMYAPMSEDRSFPVGILGKKRGGNTVLLKLFYILKLQNFQREKPYTTSYILESS